jgi:hypothetical protein
MDTDCKTQKQIKNKEEYRFINKIKIIKGHLENETNLIKFYYKNINKKIEIKNCVDYSKEYILCDLYEIKNKKGLLFI